MYDGGDECVSPVQSRTTKEKRGDILETIQAMTEAARAASIEGKQRWDGGLNVMVDMCMSMFRKV
jgi:hypothetical protein